MTNTAVKKGRSKGRLSTTGEIPSEMMTPIGSDVAGSSISERISEGLELSYKEQLLSAQELINKLEKERGERSGTIMIAGYEAKFEIVDPKTISPASVGFNRAEGEFNNINDIKESIDDDGIISPLHLRRTKNDSQYRYERIAGETRIRIALELGLKVPAFVFDCDLDDKTFEKIADTENSKRRSKSDWSDGMTYLSCLERGIYESQLDLANHLKLTPARVNQKIALAKYFPDNLVDWFDDHRYISTARFKSLIEYMKLAEKGDTKANRVVKLISDIYLGAYNDDISDKYKAVLLNSPSVLSEYLAWKNEIKTEFTKLSRDEIEQKIEKLELESRLKEVDVGDKESLKSPTTVNKTRSRPLKLYFREDLKNYSDSILFSHSDNAMNIKMKGAVGQELGGSILGCFEDLVRLYDGFSKNSKQADACLKKAIGQLASDPNLIKKIINDVRSENLSSFDDKDRDE